MVPLMVLVISPALEALRPQWREAAQNLGATTTQYWRHVAAPVLLPNIIGSVALLFCSSFSAYATAYALTNGTLPIVSLQINQQLNGNVLSGAEPRHIAAALAVMMIVIVIPLTGIYQLMERRTAKWLQS
jgi:putative spermidine/putrescine transport system permease protein